MVSPGLAASQQLRGATGAVAGRVLKYQGANQVWALGGHHGGCGRTHRVSNQDRFKTRCGGGEVLKHLDDVVDQLLPGT